MAGARTLSFSAPATVEIRLPIVKDNSDTLELDQALWGGGLLVADVVNTFATVVGSGTEFDFGGGNVLVIQGFTTPGLIADDIVLI